jgi:hypothetical protein
MAKNPNHLGAYLTGTAVLIFLSYLYLASLDRLYISLYELYSSVY